MAGADQLIAGRTAKTVRPAARRPQAARGLRAAVLISAAAHLTLLWCALSLAGRAIPSATSAASASRMQIRLAADQPASARSPAPAAIFAGPGGGPETGLASDLVAPPPLTTIAERTSSPPVPLPVPETSDRPLLDTAGAPRGVPEPVGAAPPEARASIGVDGYLPRSELSLAPAPIGEIDLRWPHGWLAAERDSGTFWMFIDETGIVRKFEPDGPALAPPLEEVARSTFMSARFEPGRRDGRAVKSLIRIEVVFDNRPSSAPAPSVVAERIL